MVVESTLMPGATHGTTPASRVRVSVVTLMSVIVDLKFSSAWLVSTWCAGDGGVGEVETKQGGGQLTQHVLRQVVPRGEVERPQPGVLGRQLLEHLAHAPRRAHQA